MADNNAFEYSYSPKIRAEVESILRKFGIDELVTQPDESLLEKLREIEKQVSRPGKIIGWTVGIVGTLVMGTGMSMVMVGPKTMFFPGILVGLIGIGLVVLAYPLSRKVTRFRRSVFTRKVRGVLKRFSESIS